MITYGIKGIGWHIKYSLCLAIGAWLIVQKTRQRITLAKFSTLGSLVRCLSFFKNLTGNR